MVIGACLCKSSHLLLPIFHGAPHLLACEQPSQCSPSAGTWAVLAPTKCSCLYDVLFKCVELSVGGPSCLKPWAQIHISFCGYNEDGVGCFCQEFCQNNDKKQLYDLNVKCHPWACTIKDCSPWIVGLVWNAVEPRGGGASTVAMDHWGASFRGYSLLVPRLNS